MKLNEIIIVEDNETMRLGMAESLRREGYTIYEFSNGPDALSHFKEKAALLVITDLRMEPMDGLEVLREIKKINPESEVLLVSAYGTVQDAVNAMHIGAADFLTKPFSTEELRIRVKKIMRKIEKDQMINKLREENRYLQEEISHGYKQIVGGSAPIQEIFNLIERVANGDSTILIEGESGTGKELAAREIHRKSKRAACPFIRVNCGALSDTLLESELFGHEKGSFTGAVRQRKGRFELADGGTLFLDEIGDVSPAMQVKLLRALQEKEFERVGGEKTINVDVRIIAATNKNLLKLIMENKFREDLYYRLNVIPIKLPALRQRREDIPLLVHYFLDKLNDKNTKIKTISDGGIQLLSEYSWPGNIRELENLIERLYVIYGANKIPDEMIAHYLGNARSITTNFENMDLEDALFAFEKNIIVHALKKADGVKNRAAKILGIRTSTLYYKIEKFGLLK
jgi:DNA-binding NtrC family response regulator